MTYISLAPLTLGVMLACSGKHAFGGELVGVIHALLATIIFVTQNIFSKKLFNEAAKAEAEGLGAQSQKLDKLNLLCYSSGLAFLVTLPIWLWSEGWDIIRDFASDGAVDLSSEPNSFDHGRLSLEFLFNGTFHFAQNILAFVLLSMVSPVTYSVASLIKRVFVILMAILWFRSPTTNTQGFGIALTFMGLYLYDRTNGVDKADKRARLLANATGGTPLLPINERSPVVPLFGMPLGESPSRNGSVANGSFFPTQAEIKKSDEPAKTAGTAPAWLPPGTKQEDTWRNGDPGIGVR